MRISAMCPLSSSICADPFGLRPHNTGAAETWKKIPSDQDNKSPRKADPVRDDAD
jgi:hypothetical protein